MCFGMKRIDDVGALAMQILNVGFGHFGGSIMKMDTECGISNSSGADYEFVTGVKRMRTVDADPRRHERSVVEVSYIDRVSARSAI